MKPTDPLRYHEALRGTFPLVDASLFLPLLPTSSKHLHEHHDLRTSRAWQTTDVLDMIEMIAAAQ